MTKAELMAENERLRAMVAQLQARRKSRRAAYTGPACTVLVRLDDGSEYRLGTYLRTRDGFVDVSRSVAAAKAFWRAANATSWIWERDAQGRWAYVPHIREPRVIEARPL